MVYFADEHTANRKASKRAPRASRPSPLERPDEGTLIQRTLASLQLPHARMPATESAAADASSSSPSLQSSQTTEQQEQQQTPVASIRIMVVADLDLASASALAEYTMRQKKYGIFDASLIDLIIACGPFCRDDDLASYVRGKQQICKSRMRLHPPQHPAEQQQQQYQQGDRYNRISETPPASLLSSSPAPNWTLTPFFRTRDETAALEGLMTAALSQLESIVCRVVYCPGSSDPLSTLTTSRGERQQQQLPTSTTGNTNRHQRLTPNSRNVHQQWMPLAPGLGCGGLFYLDAANDLMSSSNKATSYSYKHLKRAPQHSPPTAYEREDASYETDEEGEHDSMEVLSEEIAQLRRTHGYYQTFSRLLQLAFLNRKQPQSALSSPALPFRSSRAQSIVISHYVDSSSITGRRSSASNTLVNPNDDIDDNDDDNEIDAEANDAPVNGCPSWALEDLDDEEDGQKFDASSREVSPAVAWKPMPWPVVAGNSKKNAIASDDESSSLLHQTFLSQTETRQDLCLEIASGAARWHEARWIRSTPLTGSSALSPADVLLPGSLRERGEFCLVELGLFKTLTEGESGELRRTCFAWKVVNIDLHHFNEFPE